jgi:hypothetical protein
VLTNEFLFSTLDGIPSAHIYVLIFIFMK